MKVKKQRTKKLRVVIIAILLAIGVCGFVLINGNTKIELSKFTAQIVKAFGDTSETIISQWDISASSEDSVTATLYGDGRLVISGTGEMQSSFIDTDVWSSYREEIKSVIIQEGVKNIGEILFADCTNLSNVELAESVMHIGTQSFAGCGNLTDITIPKNVYGIGYGAFNACAKLENINVDTNNENFKSIDGILFSYDGTLLIKYPEGKNCTEYVIPNGVLNIGTSAFVNSSSLVQITIPDGLTNIEGWAFENCANLSSVNIPNGVESIGEWTFYECKNLEQITIPDSVTSIGNGAFANCSSLKQMTIPNGVTNIGSMMFDGCSSLNEININENVTSIGERAFYYCSSLTSIKVPSSVTNIGDFAFSYCVGLTSVEIPENLESIGSLIFAESKLTIDTDTKEVMPEIMKRALDENDILYAEEIEITNCEYDEQKNVFKINASTAIIEVVEGVLDELTIEINLIDNEKPKINSVTGNTTEWTNQDITLIINATDEVSGIASENAYSFDNGEKWQTTNSKTYADNISGIVIKVKDALGNIATYEQTINIEKIDKRIPTIEITPNGATTSQSQNITITAEDNGGSGLSNENSYQYQLGTSSTEVPTGTWQDYTNGTEFTIGEGLTGDYYIWVKAVTDNAGNESSETEYIVSNKYTFDNTIKDTTEPTINSVTGNATEWTNQSVTLTINATDNESGIAGYSFDNGENWQTTNSKTYTGNTDGIIIKVKDNEDNVATYAQTINIDKIDTTEATISSVSGNATGWTNGNVTLTISATDNESGIAGYSFDNGENWQTTNSKTYTGNTDGIIIKVKDNAGNITPYGETIKIDKIDTTDATINSVSGNATAWTNQSVTLTINATDSESGIAEYSFDDGENWQTTNSKTYTKNTNEIKIKVKDNAGNITPYGETIKIDKIDNTAPTITITPNGSNTSQSQNITIIAEDNGGSGLSNENSYQYQLGTSSTEVPTGTWQDYTNGTEFTIGDGLTGDYYIWVKNIFDNAGNEAAESDYIVSNKFMFDNSEDADTTAPELSVEYSTTQLTKESVTVTIKSNEEIQEVNGWILEENDKTLTKVYTKNVTENIDVYDIAGNKATIQVKIENIDTTAPELSVKYDIIQPTNKSVTATITANEQMQQLEGWTISEDGKTLTKIYTENTEKNIDVYDLAGNKSTVQVKITNIDKTEIQATVEYSTTILTNKNVIVKIISNKEIKEVEGWTLLEDKKTLTKEYAGNSNEDVILQDLVGNEREIKISVQNIDKIAPKVDVEYSTLKQTNKSITVTIAANEDLKSLEGWTLEEDGKTLTKIYSKNITENIDVYDLAGNKVTAKITIRNIDTTLPNIEVKYSTTENTKEDVVVTIVSDEQLQEVDGWTISEDGKTLTKKYEKNVEETIKIYDIAGNELEVQISVKNIDKTTTQKPVVEDTQNSEKPDTAPSRIPDAGSNTLIGVIIITIIIIISIVLWTKNRKLKDIK